MSALKKIISFLLAAALLASLTVALSAGSSDDPLITLSYLSGTYTSSLTGQAKLKSDEMTARLSEEASEKFESLAGNYVLAAPNSDFSAGYSVFSFSPGDKITIFSGASIIVTSGASLISVKSGELIDVSGGTAVSLSDSDNPSARLARNNIRYFAAENSSVVFTCYAAGSIAVDGYYDITRGNGTAPGLLFTDIPADYWAADYIYSLADRKLVNGTGGTSFEPLTTMTRAMFVTVIGRLAGVNTASYTSSSFSDVDAASWYAPYVAWASKKGIVTGYEDGTFAPNAAVTREQMAVIIIRYIDYAGLSLREKNSASDFPDASLISSWALDSVSRAQRLGLITGRDNGNFDPKGTANRAEVCTVLYRLIQSM